MIINKRRGAFAGAVALITLAAGGAAGLAGCSSVQPSIGQYAIVTGQGSFSNQEIKDVVPPGGHIKVNNGYTIWYLPAQFRNYVTAPDCQGADRCRPQTVLTARGTGANKGQPGMPVQVWTYVGFELNPAIERKVNGRPDFSFAKTFLPFCLKYACANQDSQIDTSNAAKLRSSDPGWLDMLNEVMPHAEDNAAQTALKGFGPSLWSDKSQYPALGDAISRNLDAELQKMDNSPSGMPYFCGPGSTPVKCTGLTVLVNNVTPTDPAVVQAYNQQLSTAYQAQAAQARANLAKKLYGGDGGWFLGMKDLISQCAQARVSCNIYAGNAPFHP